MDSPSRCKRVAKRVTRGYPYPILAKFVVPIPDPATYRDYPIPVSGIPYPTLRSMVVVGSGVDGVGSVAGVPGKPHRKFEKGWKSNNGFRSGYFQRCEDSIRQEFPSSDIKGSPHIVSKISLWKTSYTSLRNILERTGVEFSSNGDYKIDIDDEQWEHVVQVDPKAKFIRNKSSPFWETWKCIYGKDRATGAGAKSVSVAAARLGDPDVVSGGSHCDESDSLPDFTPPPPPQVGEPEENPLGQPNSSANSDKPSSTAKMSDEKRKAIHTDAMLMDFLATLHVETNSKLEMISLRISYDFDLGQARQAVFDKLSDVDGLTIDQRYLL
ncbi:hypothetical protein SASPL_108496 [Salvia splendens]|uniref:Uncharacterized protein n=1 Tax=Salvia splendens TaxID=180675 RepID=A0A8X8YEU8_SALSN|nr:hypothetical protein SASPL_108496 [Salvia splendens]